MQSKENKITSCEKDNYLCTQWKQRKQGQLKKNSIQVIQMKRFVLTVYKYMKKQYKSCCFYVVI